MGTAPAEADPEVTGRIIIEWPAAGAGSPLKGWGVRLLDAATGALIVTAQAADVIVHADANRPVVCYLTQLTGPDGQPLQSGAPLHADGDGVVARDVFRYEVAEMRVQS